jgi:hypothetical protein
MEAVFISEMRLHGTMPQKAVIYTFKFIQVFVHSCHTFIFVVYFDYFLAMQVQ